MALQSMNCFVSEYSEDGEELPLGPNFQHLVSLYLMSVIITEFTE